MPALRRSPRLCGWFLPVVCALLLSAATASARPGGPPWPTLTPDASSRLRAAAADPAPLAVPGPHVTLYTANVCPFCPIIKRRLAELQRQHRFAIEEVDVTFRPEIVRAKGLRSVPVLEANGRRLVGNATSAQITEFLRAGPSSREVTG